MEQPELDLWHMTRALELAERGRGWVEPNPMVGALVAHGAEIIGEGWHRKFGGPHAEINALAVAGSRAHGGTLYVTLEPCRHFGKTAPCTRAIIEAGIRRVVVAMRDPFSEVSGQGIQELLAAGIEVTVGVHEEKARSLNAPYLKLIERGRPWVVAKWAMTLDGKLAAASGDSRWISHEESRRESHLLRGRMDAILVGINTVRLDDPQLTVRPAGCRVPARIVLDSRASISPSTRLVQTARETPLLIAAGEEAPAEARRALEQAGCEVLLCRGATHGERLESLLAELGKRRWTNILVEGGGRLLGSFLDRRLIDEVHVFLAAKLIGGAHAPSPIAGEGILRMADALQLADAIWRQIGPDLYLQGRLSEP